ncbi:DnaD domain protein [Desulfosporosinus sp. OT]|uniref:DnaD domain protein n=1 Tax=Desulfosporosinus sp. OT TaxID=913865 RepID=UPI000223A8AA|nr:DnaD domain protein [Desulfosporosinus sp. OT]EGW40488.1 dnaD and phage-associated domain protein [Desulfosporosinus sp. OT]
MKLHNRQLKGDFFSDPDILQWPRDKRFFYAGLVQIADDSGCLDDNEFSFKILIFPSPLDADLTIERLSIWKKELIAEKKLISYTSQGKKCLYVRNFCKHQKIKNPTAPSVPLPVWVSWIPSKSNEYAGRYAFDQDRFNSILHSPDDVLSNDLDSSYKVLTNVLQEPYEELTDVYQLKLKLEPKLELKENTDDEDDNAQAREEIKNQSLEAIQEEPESPILEVGTTEVDDVSLPEDTFRLPIGLDPTSTEPEKPVHGNGLGFQAITFAELNFGRILLPIERSSISDFCRQFKNRASPDPDAIVIEGIKRCVEHYHCEMSYLKRIIFNWLDYGVVDLSHIAHADAERSMQKMHNQSSGKHVKTKSRGGNDNAKNLGTSRQRINDTAAYDPSAWARAGFAVTT